MEGLGRVFNVVPVAESTILNMDGIGGITFICTGGEAFTVTVGTSHAAAATDPGDIFNHYYENSAGAGATAWVKTAVSPASNIVTPTAIGALYVDRAMVTGYKYIKCAKAAGGTVIALLHDLDVQRTPANLVRPNV